MAINSVSTNYIERYSTNENRNKPIRRSITKEEVQEEGNSRRKFVMAGLALAASAIGIYQIGRRGYLGERIENLMRRESSAVADNIEKGVERRIDANGKDILGYEIKPPKISDLEAGEEALKTSKLEGEYDKIRQDIARNSEVQGRYNEIVGELKETAGEINKEFKAIVDDGREYSGGVIERAILQKRYYSLNPDTTKKGYCCKDPLLYKEAREEAIDIQTGYHILEPYQNGGYSMIDDTATNQELLSGLRKKYADKITEEDNKFIDECTEKLNCEYALCCGENSVMHASELARVGKIFREAMGIEVK